MRLLDVLTGDELDRLDLGSCCGPVALAFGADGRSLVAATRIGFFLRFALER